MPRKTIDLLSWNIEQGGYDRRHIFDTKDVGPAVIVPEREDAIKALVHQQHKSGVDSAAFIDAYGWGERYGSGEKIAKHLGFAAARFVSLADDRIDRVLGPGAGLAFATDYEIERSVPIDLDNRQGLGAILNLGGRTLQIATIYLDDRDEELRLAQLRALLNNLEPEPTIITGDINSLRPNMRGASISTKAHDLGFRALAFSCTLIPSQKMLGPILAAIGRAHHAPTVEYYRRAIRNMDHRRVVPELGQHGWQDADPEKQLTFRKLGGLGVDYAFSNSGVTTNDFQIISAGGASDHDAIRVRATVL